MGGEAADPRRAGAATDDAGGGGILGGDDGSRGARLERERAGVGPGNAQPGARRADGRDAEGTPGPRGLGGPGVSPSDIPTPVASLSRAFDAVASQDDARAAEGARGVLAELPPTGNGGGRRGETGKAEGGGRVAESGAGAGGGAVKAERDATGGIVKAEVGAGVGSAGAGAEGVGGGVKAEARAGGGHADPPAPPPRRVLPPSLRAKQEPPGAGGGGFQGPTGGAGPAPLPTAWPPPKAEGGAAAGRWAGGVKAEPLSGSVADFRKPHPPSFSGSDLRKPPSSSGPPAAPSAPPPPPPSGPRPYMIGGVPVLFPNPPYGVQMAFMSKCISALDAPANALLEAPTGSGKTLSLLCSTLAWQLRERDRMADARAKLLQAMVAEGGAGQGDGPGGLDGAVGVGGAACLNSPESAQAASRALLDELPTQALAGFLPEDAVPTGKEPGVGPGWRAAEVRRGAAPGGVAPAAAGSAPVAHGTVLVGGRPVALGAPSAPPPPIASFRAGAAGASDPDAPPPSLALLPEERSALLLHQQHAQQQLSLPPTRPPRIFYATRTHSQIAQVASELRRTQYRPRMAILAGRKHYCVHGSASRKANVDEACDALLKDNACMFFKGTQSLVQSSASRRLHDVEDLKAWARGAKGCPYYLSRKWAKEADLVFAPYQYLIDPVIRRALEIETDRAVLIFDEAHNMEDASREAAGLELVKEAVVDAALAFGRAETRNGKPEAYARITALFRNILAWIERHERAERDGTAAADDRGPPGAAPSMRGGMRNAAAAAAAAAYNPYGARGGTSSTHRSGSSSFNAFTPSDPIQRVYGHARFSAELAALGLGPADVEPLWEAYQIARADDEDAAAAAHQPGARMGVDAVPLPGEGEDEEGGASGRGGGGGAGGRGAGGAGPPAPSASAPGERAVAPGDLFRVGAAALGALSRTVQIARLAHQGTDDGGRDFRLVFEASKSGRGLGGAPLGRGGGSGDAAGGGDDAAAASYAELAEGIGLAGAPADGGAASPPPTSTQRSPRPSQSPASSLVFGSYGSLLGSAWRSKFCLWCLSPAVAFRPLAKDAHAALLTSGTLAPLESFSSELGVPFPIRLEAPHVIDMAKQVYVAALATGAGGGKLLGTYRTSREHGDAYLDCLGETLRRLARLAPGGVLAFFPSYSALGRAARRWRESGLWAKLGEESASASEWESGAGAGGGRGGWRGRGRGRGAGGRWGGGGGAGGRWGGSGGGGARGGRGGSDAAGGRKKIGRGFFEAAGFFKASEGGPEGSDGASGASSCGSRARGVPRYYDDKVLTAEPRGGGQEALAQCMDEHYGAVASGRGSLLLAVCRGKVSEGIDFADANARMVVLVGIPYPSATDRQVAEKRAHNDAGRARGLLPGSAWYAQQAFRALNQALGRCIRHRFDYGAVVLLDERFRNPAQQRGLSRWVRGALTQAASLEEVEEKTTAFFQRLEANPPGREKKAAQAGNGVAQAGSSKAVEGSSKAAGGDGDAWNGKGEAATGDGGNGVSGFQKPSGAGNPPLPVPALSGAPDALRHPASGALRPAAAFSIPPSAPPPPASSSLPSGSVSASLARLPLAAWLREDLVSFRAFLASRGVELGALAGTYASLDDVALDGVLDCFQAALEDLDAGTGLPAFAAAWQSALPTPLALIVEAERRGAGGAGETAAYAEASGALDPSPLAHLCAQHGPRAVVAALRDAYAAEARAWAAGGGRKRPASELDERGAFSSGAAPAQPPGAGGAWNAAPAHPPNSASARNAVPARPPNAPDADPRVSNANGGFPPAARPVHPPASALTPGAAAKRQEVIDEELRALEDVVCIDDDDDDDFA